MTVLQKWHQWPEGYLLPVPHIGDLDRNLLCDDETSDSATTKDDIMNYALQQPHKTTEHSAGRAARAMRAGHHAHAGHGRHHE